MYAQAFLATAAPFAVYMAVLYTVDVGFPAGLLHGLVSGVVFGILFSAIVTTAYPDDVRNGTSGKPFGALHRAAWWPRTRNGRVLLLAWLAEGFMAGLALHLNQGGALLRSVGLPCLAVYYVWHAGSNIRRTDESRDPGPPTLLPQTSIGRSALALCVALPLLVLTMERTPAVFVETSAVALFVYLMWQALFSSLQPSSVADKPHR